jgi:predicted enzyme related to lactoylglutathione lyase
VDLMSTDPDRSYAFYGELFGWTVEDPGPDYGGYVTLHKEGASIAGCMRNGPEMGGMPDVWSVYLAVEDAAATVDAATAAGGDVIVPAMPVMELGSMAMVTDAGGAAIGMWQPGLHQGMEMLGEPGTPNWFELHTREWEKTLAFYRDTFGWDIHIMSDTPEFRYATLGEGDDALAGIMDASAFLPEGVPPHWSIYFGVENADAALAKIVELGGALCDGGGGHAVWTLATATDATGAMFKIVQPL